MRHLIAHAVQKTGIFDVKTGFAMLKSREVPVGLKLGALTVGVLLTFLLASFEVPLEAIVAALLPIIGFAIDVAIDGAEFVLLPLLFAAGILPHLVARKIRRSNIQARP